MYIADMHCDTISKIYEKDQIDKDYGDLKSNGGHLDLTRMKDNEYLLQNFALFVNKGVYSDVYDQYKRLLKLAYQEIDRNSDVIGIVHNYNEIEENIRIDKMSALLTVEEGGVCKGDIELLHKLYDDGIRLMTLTWNYRNELGYPNIDANRCEGFAKGNGTNLMTDDVLGFYKVPDIHNGLTTKGIEFVREMQDIGMIVDVSHLSDAGFYDVLENTTKPFTASHSNSRSISSWVRNLTDDMLRKLGDRGGIAGLNYCPDFLTEVPFGTPNPGTMEAVVSHAMHMANTGGIECVCLGSDFDGIDINHGIPGVQSIMKLAEMLHTGGFTYDEVEKICYKNVLRFYSDVL